MISVREQNIISPIIVAYWLFVHNDNTRFRGKFVCRDLPLADMSRKVRQRCTIFVLQWLTLDMQSSFFKRFLSSIFDESANRLTSNRIGSATVCALFKRGKHNKVLFREENDEKFVGEKFTERDERIEPERESVMTGSSYLDLPRDHQFLPAYPLFRDCAQPTTKGLRHACEVSLYIASTVAGREIYKYADGGRPVVPFPCTTQTTNPDHPPPRKLYT